MSTTQKYAGIILCLYESPGGPDWATALAVATANPLVKFLIVFNPNNGPVASQAASYAAAMAAFEGLSNVTWYGYVELDSVTGSNVTGLQPANIGGLESQAAQYTTGYGGYPKGVFFDVFDGGIPQATLSSGANDLGEYCASIGLGSMANPGTNAVASGTAIGCWCVYENGGAGQPAPSYFSAVGLPVSQMALISYGWATYSASYVESIAASVAWLNIGADAGGADGPYGVVGACTQWLAATAATLTALISAAAPVVPPVTTPPPPPPPPVNPPPPTTATETTLTVATQDAEGATLLGYDIQISPTSASGASSAYSPASFSVNVNTSYLVTPQNYGNWSFDYWEDTLKVQAARTVKIGTAPVSLVAIYYNTTAKPGHHKRAQATRDYEAAIAALQAVESQDPGTGND